MHISLLNFGEPNMPWQETCQKKKIPFFFLNWLFMRKHTLQRVFIEFKVYYIY